PGALSQPQLDQATHPRRATLDRDLDAPALGLDVGRHHAGREVVSVSDVGRENHNASGRRNLLLVALSLVPLDVAPDPFGERCRGSPPEFFLSAPGRYLLPREVSEARLRMDDLACPKNRSNRFGYLEDGNALSAGKVVNSVGGGRLQRGHNAFREILDIDEPSRLVPAPGQYQRLAGKGSLDKGANDAPIPSTGAVRNPEAQDRELEPVELPIRLAVHLSGQLCRGVE